MKKLNLSTLTVLLTLLINKTACCLENTIDKNKQNFLYVNFYESIKKVCPEYEKNTAQYMDQSYRLVNYPGMTNRQILNTIVDIYEKNNPSIEKIRNNQKIPKIIHHIWLGSPLPEKYKRFQSEWIKNNPEWEYKIWTDKDIVVFEEQNKELFKNLKQYSYATKSDILRCEILYKFGGLYIDTDYEFVKHFDIFNDNYEFYCCMEPLCSNVVIGNTVIGSIPGHPILKTYLDNLKENFKKWDNTNMDNFDRALAKTGPSYFTRCILETIDKFGTNISQNLLILPPTYFYPPVKKQYSNNGVYHVPVISAETYGVHYWDLSWAK